VAFKTQALNDKEKEVRESAGEALGDIGIQAETVVPALPKPSKTMISRSVKPLKKPSKSSKINN
jgi:hypothetical protein